MVTPVEEALARAARDLLALGARWALVGGLAVVARSEPRLTRDVDLAVLATARLLPPKPLAEVHVDLMFAATGLEQQLVIDAEALELVAGMVLPVARLGHLIAMKVLASLDRAKGTDAEDLRALVARADGLELARAQRGVEAITAAGLDRGHDLVAALAAATRQV